MDDDADVSGKRVCPPTGRRQSAIHQILFSPTTFSPALLTLHHPFKANIFLHSSCCCQTPCRQSAVIHSILFVLVESVYIVLQAGVKYKYISSCHLNDLCLESTTSRTTENKHGLQKDIFKQVVAEELLR